jgi:hypothetical protein
VAEGGRSQRNDVGGCRARMARAIHATGTRDARELSERKRILRETRGSMNPHLFVQLLAESEGPRLDYKRDTYDLSLRGARVLGCVLEFEYVACRELVRRRRSCPCRVSTTCDTRSRRRCTGARRHQGDRRDLVHAPNSKMVDRCTIAGVAPRLKPVAGAFNRSVKRRMAGRVRWQYQ